MDTNPPTNNNGEIGRYLAGRIVYKVLPFVILLFVPLVALTVYNSTKRDVYDSINTKFQEEIEHLKLDLNERTQFYIEGFRGVQGLFESSTKVERGEFITYINRTALLNRYKGIATVNYLEKVTDKDAFLNELKSDPILIEQGISDIKIIPDLNKEEYYIVKYIEPLATEKNLIGFDAASDPIRFDGITKSILSGDPTVTSIVRSPSSSKPIFLILLPVYLPASDVSSTKLREQNAIGVIAGAFRTEEFFSFALEEEVTSRSLNIKIYDSKDISQLSDDNLLYKNNLDSAAASLNLNRKLLYEIADGSWVLDVSFIPDQSSNQLLATPALRFGAVVVVGFLLFLISYILTRRVIIIREIAEKYSLESLVFEKTFHKISKGSSELFFALSNDLKFVAISDKLSTLLQMPMPKFKGVPINDPLVPGQIRDLTQQADLIKAAKLEIADGTVKINGHTPDLYKYEVQPLKDNSTVIGIVCSFSSMVPEESPSAEA